MGFLGDLFATKGTVEARVSVTKLPKGASFKYKVGYVQVKDAARPRPHAAPDDTRWTGSTDLQTIQRALPVGAYWMVVVVQPILQGRDGKMTQDKAREVPFWPLEKPVNVTAGDTSIVRVDLVFPAAGLG